MTEPSTSASFSGSLTGPRAELAKAIPRRPRVVWWIGGLLALAFALIVVPSITTERWLGSTIKKGEPAPVTVRVPLFAGYEWDGRHLRGGGVLITRGETATLDDELDATEISASTPRGATPYIAFLLLLSVLGAIFTHHVARSNAGRLLRVQIVSLALIAAAAVAVKVVMLTTAVSVLAIPVAVFALVPTMVLDRIVGLATGTLCALIISLLVPFDFGIAILLLVQAGVAGLVVAERPKARWRAALTAGAVATVCTGLTYPLMRYLTSGAIPFDELRAPLKSAWVAAALGPAIATAIAVPLIPLYQLLVGEITHGKLVQLEDLSHPLLRQIAERAPGTWQHSLNMANMAEIAANAIGANGRLVRVGAYFHDLGKSLQPKYFIENLEPGETSPHDKLPPDVSCDAIFAHVTEGIVTARRAGLHERIVDFMHMHHGNGVLEYFWAKCREQGNPKGLTIGNFRYPGVPPQSRETAILAICDAVEAAARTLKKPDAQSIDSLVQRIVYGKLHLGQLDESGLSMSDLRRLAESLRETIRHANHGRIEYPWQKAEQDASASAPAVTGTAPRLDSLDRTPKPDAVRAPARITSEDALAVTDNAQTPRLKRASTGRDSQELATKTTAPHAPPPSAAKVQKWHADAVEVDPASVSVRFVPPGTLPGTASTVPYEKIDTGQMEKLEKLSLRDSGNITKPVERPSLGSLEPSIEIVRVEPDPEPTPTAQADRYKEATPTLPEERIKLEEHQPGDSMSRGRVTLEIEPRTSSADTDAFVKEATAALGEAARDVAKTDDPSKEIELVAASDISKPIEKIAPAEAAPPVIPETPSAARKRASTLPPIVRPPTMPPPIRRAGTVPPPADVRPPLPGLDPRLPLAAMDPKTMDSRPTVLEPKATLPPTPLVRPPALFGSAGANATLPPPGPQRKPALIVEETEDGEVTIQPAPADATSDDASTTQPRLDAQLDEDFGTETPVVAPTRAELQALLRNTPPDPTRKQSIEEIERLHRGGGDPTRRAPYPTAEVDESDIEAAIELAPPARRTSSLGVAKKKPES